MAKIKGGVKIDKYIKQRKYNSFRYNTAKLKEGFSIRMTEVFIKEQKVESSNDTQNRKYVVDTIKKYVKSGKNINEALDLIMEDDDIIKKFEYLKKNGLNIRNVFYNWVKNYLSNEEKEGFDRDE